MARLQGGESGGICTAGWKPGGSTKDVSGAASSIASSSVFFSAGMSSSFTASWACFSLSLAALSGNLKLGHPMHMPHAMATTFLRAPESSAPTMSVV
jgi:hypothetical protein